MPAAACAAPRDSPHDETGVAGVGLQHSERLCCVLLRQRVDALAEEQHVCTAWQDSRACGSCNRQHNGQQCDRTYASSAYRRCIDPTGRAHVGSHNPTWGQTT